MSVMTAITAGVMSEENFDFDFEASADCLLASACRLSREALSSGNNNWRMIGNIFLETIYGIARVNSRVLHPLVSFV